MEKDIDQKLYNEYLNGEKEAFELLYNKYKKKIEYFIYNIVKDYQKAEDITQETFIYIIQNKMKENYSFKYYIYLIAKSRAINYVNIEKRRNEIKEKYLSDSNEQIEKDILEDIIKEETRKEVLEGLEKVDEKYKNAVYLTKIEGLSYKETAEILGETLQNTKNLVHRGKKQLRTILFKKGFDNMNKTSKIIITIICISTILTGVVYAATHIIKKNNTNHNITIKPTYESTIDENTINNLWIGTLDLAWKDLEEKIGKDKIELEENIKIADELNASKFSKDMLDSNDYTINVERTWTNGYKIDATLNKQLNFLEVFDNFSNDYNWTFGNSEELIKYFGINNASSENMNKNVEILFYNRKGYKPQNNDFAVKLKTKEGDEIILYRTDDNKTFEEYYEDIKNKTNAYTGKAEFLKNDELIVPYVRVNGMISYDELYEKEIKNTNGLYIYDVIQNVNFSLNEKGCNLSSKATMVTEYMSVNDEARYCYFKDKFVIFMKEADSDNPYFALKVDNSDILEKKEENDEPKILDYTMMGDADLNKFEKVEYKFFEDDKYEYYYPIQKTKYVQVYFKNGENMMTAEEALKEGKITLDLLDKYEVEYIKKEKE